jgi:hypothetical protein
MEEIDVMCRVAFDMQKVKVLLEGILRTQKPQSNKEAY